MEHAKFLLNVECNGTPVTLNDYFSQLDESRGNRYQARIKETASVLALDKVVSWWLSNATLEKVVLAKSGNVDIRLPGRP